MGNVSFLIFFRCPYVQKDGVFLLPETLEPFLQIQTRISCALTAEEKLCQKSHHEQKNPSFLHDSIIREGGNKETEKKWYNENMNKKLLRVFVLCGIVLILCGIIVVKKGIFKKMMFHDWELAADETFTPEEVLDKGYPVMLDIGTSWCGPCIAMHPVLEETALELKNKAILRYLEVDTYPALSRFYQTPYYPTQIFFDDKGNAYGVHYGYLDKNGIYEIFAEMGYELR